MRRIRKSLLGTWTVWLLLGGGLSAAETTREIGLARQDVTPSYPVRMTGYSNRKAEFEGVEQSLWAKALAIGSDAEGPAVLITLDNLGVPGSMTDEVARRLLSKHGVKRERFVICASHTHCAPALAGVAPMIFVGDLPDEHRQHIERYTRELTDKLEQVALAALAARQPGRLSWAEGSADFAVNRRRIQGGKVSFGITPWPAGRVDHSLP
ncbi:MAG TPA: neutral/alkaline non-lysosomal ceramidase N-terminal domain-containing protein, partial [Pirellulales bacterium]|nr:neutral/alkaline non-lysosomal ceramidase N-terminal domain-containing protein [Pirellulales bacterium]